MTKPAQKKPAQEPTPSRPAPSQPRTPGLVAAGGWPFLVTAFVARMPSSMVQLGYLMVLSQGGRGLAAGGMAVAAVGLGSAIGAPLVGRFVDRFGPLPVVAGATLLSLAGQLLFLHALRAGASTALLLACAAIVGAANPQVGPVARSHWSHLATRGGTPALVGRALGYEGAVDELGFVVGPVLASALVSSLGATDAALAMAVLTLLLQGAFVAHLWRDRAAWPLVPPPERQAGDAAGVGIAGLWPVLACLAVGLLFGATQTMLTALFAQRGTPAVTGIVYGCVGIGSGLASLLVGRLARHVGVANRVLAGGVVVLVGCLLMMQLPGALLAAAFGVLLGAGAGVTLVSSFGWMEEIAPRHLVATMMTVLATAIVIGVSAGAAVAGRLSADPSHAMYPVLGAAALAVLASAGMRRQRRAG